MIGIISSSSAAGGTTYDGDDSPLVTEDYNRRSGGEAVDEEMVKSDGPFCLFT